MKTINHQSFSQRVKNLTIVIIGYFAFFDLATLLAALPQLQHDNFAEIRAKILPSDNESAWKKIPWQSDLSHALELARHEQRPVVIWAMNGDPLGCT